MVQTASALIRERKDNDMKLVITEKPSVAKSISAVLSADKRRDGYFEGENLLISWCFGIFLRVFVPGDFPGLDRNLGKSLVYLFFAAVSIAMPDGAVNSSPSFPKAGSTASGAIRKSSWIC